MGSEGRPRTIKNPLTDLGFCYLCDRLVKKGSNWTLEVMKSASRLLCEKCR